MELENKNIKIKLGANASIESIKFLDTEILYQGNESWKKKFPIIFPSLGISTGFVLKNQEYKMPRHGFWKDLEFETFYEGNKVVSVGLLMNQKKFPQIIDIVQKIALNENRITFEYDFANISKEDSYFQFGLHPGFIIDKDSYLSHDQVQDAIIIDLNGKETDEEINIHGHKISEIKFGTSFDTLIYPKVAFHQIILHNKNYDLEIKFDAINLQLWKPENDNFICIEPWYGKSDFSINALTDVTKKPGINKIKPGKIKKFVFELNIIAKKSVSNKPNFKK